MAAIIAVHCGCAADTGEPGAITRDSAGILIVESVAPIWGDSARWRVGDVITSIGSADGTTALFRVRDATRLPDGRVLVANAGTGEVLVYDSAGNLAVRLGRRGRGPGEFPRGPTWSEYLQPDTLLVVDQPGTRAIRFLSTGDHLHTETLPGIVYPVVGPDARLPDGRWVQFGETGEGSREERGLVATTLMAVAAPAGSENVDTLLTSPGYEAFRKMGSFRGQQVVMNLPRPFGAGSHHAVGGGRIAIGNGVEYEIRVWDSNGPEHRVRKRTEVRPVTNDEVQAWIDRQVDHITDPSLRAQRRRDYEDVPAAEFHPAYHALVLDGPGNLWVENHRIPGTASPRQWSLFAEDGRWLGDVRMPEDLEVHEIGNDYVLGAERDDLGVEHVKVYRLEKENRS